jgi:Flp pilus assembly protein TadG
MKRIRSEKGAALLEAAITVPMILLISVGIFEFGRAYQTWQVLTNAAREGARVAVISGTTDDAVKARVVAYMQNGALNDGAATMVTVTRGVTLTGTTDTGTQITINYPFQFMVLNPVVRLIAPTSTTGAPITMQSNALMRNEM